VSLLFTQPTFKCANHRHDDWYLAAMCGDFIFLGNDRGKAQSIVFKSESNETGQHWNNLGNSLTVIEPKLNINSGRCRQKPTVPI
jgi:hypothetical protein